MLNKIYDNTKKFIKKIDKPFSLIEYGKNYTILDSGYSIIEIVPFSENYIVRIHVDSANQIIEYFFIMSEKNEFVDGLPTFKDLKLSLVFIDNKLKIYNQDVFDNMLANNEVSKKIYSETIKNLESLINEIETKKHFIFSFDINKFL